jgi:(2Fe-2S) ferredoxin
MEKQPVPHKKIVFVCTNRRPEGERISCAVGGGDTLRDKLKAMVKERHLQSKIRVSASGCLDRCEFGPNIMVFPDNVWYSHVQESDLPAIIDDLVATLD